MANPVTKIRNTAADYRKLDGRDKRRFWTDGILNNALYILMAIFIIYTAIVNHNFLKIGSITNIISLAAASLPFALGVAGCIVLTGTDLSGGRVVGLSAALSAALLQKTDLARRMFSWMPNIPTWAGICIAILAVIAIGAIIGFVNGFFVAKFKLHPFIVTLATQLITYGLILVFFMLNDNNGQPLSGLSDGYSSFIKGKMISIGAVSLPWYVLYAIILLVITWFLWNKTTFGKNMFAVGSNAEAANVSGVLHVVQANAKDPAGIAVEGCVDYLLSGNQAGDGLQLLLTTLVIPLGEAGHLLSTDEIVHLFFPGSPLGRIQSSNGEDAFIGYNSGQFLAVVFDGCKTHKNLLLFV